MVRQEFNQGDEILEMAVQQFKQQSIPEFTNPSVAFPVESASRQHIGLASNFLKRRSSTFSNRRLVLAVGVVFAIVIGGFSVLPWESTSQRAFAQMQEAIRDLNSLVFEMKSYSGEEVTGKYHISYAQAGDVRMDSGLVSHILNVAKEEYMIVDDANRAVTIQPVYDMAAIQEKLAGVFGALLNLEPLPSTTMRTVSNDGKPAKEFKTVWDGSVATVIVDAKTNLPMKIELDRGKSQHDKPIREVATNFQFNVSLPDSSFAILPPNGYGVERIERHDPIVSSDSLILTIGKGVGPVRFGMSLQEVRNQLGDPDSFESKPTLVAELDEKGQLKLPMQLVPADPPQIVGVMQYRSLGLQIDVSSIEGVEWIRCYEKRLTWNRFGGMTSHGIKIGMSKNEVKSVLEKDESASRNWKQADDRWLLSGMDVVFENDKCVNITLGKPNIAKQQ
ncbi:hypothetical protein [Aureliella helgolandensis]|uniref:Uncharacterized protein n=1 Tax=Aureliella helgolandensis TaxID=2527968 RepID=A0A518GBB2_9BACT|nr:hypothetical protein [Aureliella helgolandensis]QDV25911.1 hypothetical protein Q31a_42390 [Aureliella helgolandensis]